MNQKNFDFLRIIITLLLFISLAKAEDADVWHQLNIHSEDKVWLVAHEETASMREKLGQWKPHGLFVVKKDHVVAMKIEQVKRENNYLNIKLKFKNQDSKYVGYSFGHYSEGEDKVFETIVVSKSNGFEIALPGSDGTTRLLVITFGDNINYFSKNFVVSKAMPLWKWDQFKVESLDNL